MPNLKPYVIAALNKLQTDSVSYDLSDVIIETKFVTLETHARGIKLKVLDTEDQQPDGAIVYVAGQSGTKYAQLFVSAHEAAKPNLAVGNG